MFLFDLFGKKKREEEARQRWEEYQRQVEAQKAAFAAELAAIPCAEIKLDREMELTRNQLRTMPEPKFSNVTKTFNPDRLPTFVVVDTETTGLKVSGGRIIELSAIRFEDYEPVEAFTTLINPGKAIPAAATEINGITNDMVKDAPTIGQVSAAFLDFVGNNPVVGYNLAFDLKFIYVSGIDLMEGKRKLFDVLPLCRKAYKDDLESFRLADVADYLDIVRDDAHRALSDCLVTGKVFADVIERITEKV